MTRSLRPAPLVLLALIAFQSALPQRKVELQPPSLGDAERAYRDAQTEWLNADPNLAADLFKGNPQDMHQRIQRTAALRDEMMEKKAVYLDLVVKHFAETRARLVGSANAQLPIPELRQSLENEQARVLGEMDRLDALIRDLPQDDLYALVLHELNAERAQLVNLQVTVAQQIRSVNAMGSSQDAANKMEAKNPLDQQLQAISKIWERERDATKVQREHWKGLYEAMDRAVSGGKAPVPPPGATGTPAAKPPAAKPPLANLPLANQGIAAPPPGSLDSGKPPVFEGVWMYQSGPNSWSGFGEPARVALELHRAGTVVSGTYKARIPGRRDVRDLDLTLNGGEVFQGKAVLQWTSLAPAAHGEMVVQIGGDRRILVERTKSSDTYIPQGMEVLLPLPAR